MKDSYRITYLDDAIAIGPTLNQKISTDTFNKILDAIEIRLNKPGEIKLSDVWDLVSGYSHSTCSIAFRIIMVTMMKQGKAFERIYDHRGNKQWIIRTKAEYQVANKYKRKVV